MSTGFIYRSTVWGVKSVAPTVAKAVALSGMSMRKALFGFRIRWANATMRTRAGIIIRHESIFMIILIYCRLGLKAYRSHLARPREFLLLFRRPLYTRKWWKGALRITVEILYTATCAESSAKRRQPDFSAFIKSGLPENGADPRSIGRQTYPAR